jgi:hypothetical protein
MHKNLIFAIYLIEHDYYVRNFSFKDEKILLVNKSFVYRLDSWFLCVLTVECFQDMDLTTIVMMYGQQ